MGCMGAWVHGGMGEWGHGAWGQMGIGASGHSYRDIAIGHRGMGAWDGRPRNRVTDPPKFQFLRKEKYTGQSHSSQRPVSRSPTLLICGGRYYSINGQTRKDPLALSDYPGLFPGSAVGTLGISTAPDGTVDTPATLNRCPLQSIVNPDLLGSAPSDP